MKSYCANDKLTGRSWQEVARTERTQLLLELDDDRRGTRHR